MLKPIARVTRALTWILPFAVTLAVAQAQAGQLDRPGMLAAVDAIARTIADEYFDADVGNKAAAHIRDFAATTTEPLQTPSELAAAVTRQLYAVTHDKHLAVTVIRTPAAGAQPSSSEIRARRGRAENFGVREVSILDGNIGYLDLRTFYRIDEARDTIAAAMQLLAHAEALIIDLRNNGGGSPETVALLAGYLFDRPGMPLFDIVSRSGDSTHYATPSPGVEPRNGSRPIFALTSSRTFSAGEGIAFILQEEKRATVVGERTPGAANPGRSYPAGPLLEVVVPNGQVRTRVSGHNWEGTGVTPDVAVPAADALATAHELAAKQVASSSEPPR